jgi:hypothetical protein
MSLRRERRGAAESCGLNPSLVAVVALLVCQGCAAPQSRYAATVKEVDAREVANCALLSTVLGRSLMVGVGSIGVTNAINDAKDNAAGLGANRIVVVSTDSGNAYTPGTATVKAYKCN